MNCAEVFLIKVNVSGSIPMQKKAVSDFSHKLVSSYTAESIGISESDIQFVYGEHGKPYIKGNPIYFNVSHCANVILAAFGQEEIGADIEIVRGFKASVAERFFTDDEKTYIDLSADNNEMNRRFFEIWTAKESFLKFCGVGLSGGFDFCTADKNGVRADVVSSELGKGKIIHCGGRIKFDENDIMLHNTSKNDSLEAEYVVSVCGREIDSIHFQLFQSI